MRYGEGSIRELNLKLKDREWKEVMIKEVTGRQLSSLWTIYCENVE